MRYAIYLTSLCWGIAGLGGCSGHALDSPIKTCKAVTQVFTGNTALTWLSEQQTEEKGVRLTVNLEFSRAGEAAEEKARAVCTYGLSSQDMDYRNAMGEYANTPSKMSINGKPIPTAMLVQAVNRATADTVGEMMQEGIKY